MILSSPFFRLLSEDLQVHVFQTWFEDATCSGPALKALSSLDVACSSHSLRQPFLLLTSLLRLTGKAKYKNDFADLSCFLMWLSDRSVAVNSLRIPIFAYTPEQRQRKAGMFTRLKRFLGLRGSSQRKLMSLPFVTQLSLGHLRETVSVAAFDKALRACPNTTSIEIRSFLNFNSPMWDVLSAASFIALKKLTVFSTLCHYSDSANDSTSLQFRKMLNIIGASVEELSFHWLPPMDGLLLESLSQHCKQLQRLECDFKASSTQSIVQLLNACHHLSDLHFHGFQGTVEDIATILAGGTPQQVKKFTVAGWIGGGKDQRIADFLTILDNHRWLDCWKVNHHWSFRRIQNSPCLSITADGLSKHIMEQIYDACGHQDLTKLMMYCDSETQDSLPAMTLFADRVGRSLLDLVLFCDRLEFRDGLVQLFPVRCPNLQRFNCVNVQLTDDTLEMIACACIHLEHVAFISTTHGGSLTFGDKGLIALLTHCPKLKTVECSGASTCTKSCLDAILALQLRLVRLVFHQTVNIVQADVDRFRELAKQQQLLPAPSVQFKSNL